MKKVIDSTDKKHIGDIIDETLEVIKFKDGEVMEVTTRLYGNRVLSNSKLRNSSRGLRDGKNY